MKLNINATHRRIPSVFICVYLWLILSSISTAATAPTPVPRNKAAQQYLQLLENFSGWAEQNWNETTQSFDGNGAGVSWARGNGDVCLVYAVLLTELPDQATFSPRKVTREMMLDHVRKTLRTLCLNDKNCTDPQAIKPGRWGGPTWQSALETEHWTFAAHLLADQLDDSTKALIKQVATAEAEVCKKDIPNGKKGDTAADDCCWNAGLLGVVAACYSDDPRASSWDEWAKKWALNIEAREPDRTNKQMVDGKPLSEWLVSTQTYPDLTLENHNFWDLPYQVCYSALSEPIMAYHICGRKIPQAFDLHVLEEGDILKWMTLADGDLLYVQGIDWAELDVQHSWAFTELGTLFDQPWARAAEARCLKLLTDRQNAFNDGSIHAEDFGYQTDLANCWAYSYLLQRYFGKADSGTQFDLPIGSKIFPYVSVGVNRTPDLISSITWFQGRNCVMIVPNNAAALGDRPSFSAYRCKDNQKQISGLGYLQLQSEKRLHPCHVDGDPKIKNDDGTLTVSFSRTHPKVATEQVGYCALPNGAVAVFTQWSAINDINVAELVNHPFYWNAIPGYLPTRTAKAVGDSAWSIDGKLRMQVIGGAGGKIESDAVLGSVHPAPFAAKSGEVFENSVCIYQAEVPDHPLITVSGDVNHLVIGDWTIDRAADGSLAVKKGS